MHNTPSKKSPTIGTKPTSSIQVAVVGTWSVLLTWRSMVADVVGANMWLAGLAVVTIPASCVALAVLLTLCAWFRRLAVSR